MPDLGRDLRHRGLSRVAPTLLVVQVAADDAVDPEVAGHPENLGTAPRLARTLRVLEMETPGSLISERGWSAPERAAVGGNHGGSSPGARLTCTRSQLTNSSLIANNAYAPGRPGLGRPR